MSNQSNLQVGINNCMNGLSGFLQDDKKDEAEKIVAWAFAKSDAGEFTDECGEKFKTQLLSLMKSEEIDVAKSILETWAFNLSF